MNSPPTSVLFLKNTLFKLWGFLFVCLLFCLFLSRHWVLIFVNFYKSVFLNFLSVSSFLSVVRDTCLSPSKVEMLALNLYANTLWRKLKLSKFGFAINKWTVIELNALATIITWNCLFLHFISLMVIAHHVPIIRNKRTWKR